MGILKGLDDGKARGRRGSELLDVVGIAEVANRKLKHFSGGMKRRVGIAQALLNDPKLLIVDEPTAGLDPEERIRFRHLLAELGGDRLVLLSTHLVEDIAQTCQRLAVLAQGRVVFQGATAELVGAAEGKVWTVPTSGRPPAGRSDVTSPLHQPSAALYPLLCTATPLASTPHA